MKTNKWITTLGFGAILALASVATPAAADGWRDRDGHGRDSGRDTRVIIVDKRDRQGPPYKYQDRNRHENRYGYNDQRRDRHYWNDNRYDRRHDWREDRRHDYRRDRHHDNSDLAGALLFGGMLGLILSQ